MNDSNEPKRESIVKRVSGMAVAAVIVALFLGAGIGAFAYRERDKGSEGKTVKAAKTVMKKQPKPYTGYLDRKQDEPGTAYAAQFATKTMFPRFDPARRYYVTRCIPGKIAVNVRAKPGTTVKVGPYPARTGDFTAEARPLPGQEFTVAIKERGERKAVPYKVRCLPATFPDWTYKRKSDPPKGRFLVSFRDKPTDAAGSWLIVFDQDGAPRWWWNPVFNTLGGQVLADGTVQAPRAFGDGFGRDDRTAVEIRSLGGRLLREIETQGAAIDGHEFVDLPNGNVLVVSYKQRLGDDLSSVGLGKNVGVLDGEIQEVTPDDKVVWRWNSADHTTLKDTPERWWEKIRQNPQRDGAGRTSYDIFHLNSIEPWGRQYVISSRHTDRVYGISRRTGEILWSLGGDPRPDSLKVLGEDPYDYIFGGQHDARMEGSVLSLHDNGTNLENEKRPPRVVRYRIDLKNRTATFISAFENRDVAPSSHCCGSARRFGDGWVVSWGERPVISGYGLGDRLAFNLTLPTPAYRAVPVPSSVSNEDLDRGLRAMETGPEQSDRPVFPFVRLDPPSN